jgi:hypothetical protein
VLSGRQDLARAAAPILSTDEVFVTNGSPSVTYVIRDDQIEAEIAARLGAKQKIMAISGPSKSGKSVLVRRVVVDTLGWQMVEVSGNDLSSIDDFWLTVGAQIGVISAADTTTQAGVEFGAEAGAEVGIPVAGKLKGTVKSNFSQADSTRLQATVDLRQAVRERLAGIDACVVIDDFHYAPEPVQKQLARGIKDLSARRIPVVLIAVSHRVLDLVQAEGELLGRVMRKQVAYWSPIELMRIAAQGFQALNVRDAGGEIAGRLVEQSFGSPLLMQELCGEICTRSSVLRTQDVERELQRPHRGSYGPCGEPRKHPALPRCWPGFLTTTRTRLRAVL